MDDDSSVHVEVVRQGDPLLDVLERVRFIEAAVKAICQDAGEGPLDAVTVLLVAAINTALRYGGKSRDETVDTLAHSLRAIGDSGPSAGATAH